MSSSCSKPYTWMIQHEYLVCINLFLDDHNTFTTLTHVYWTINLFWNFHFEKKNLEYSRFCFTIFCYLWFLKNQHYIYIYIYIYNYNYCESCQGSKPCKLNFKKSNVNDRFVINGLILKTTLCMTQCTNDLKFWMCYKINKINL